MEIRTKGKLKTEEQLREEVIDRLIDALESDITEEQALDISNAYRENNGDTELYVNDEDNINSELDGKDPYDILQMAANWDECDDYFGIDQWNELGTTSDVWEGVDMEDLADDILEGYYRGATPDNIIDIVEEYEEAVEKLNNYNEGRALAEEVVRKYVNCEADVIDLLQALDKLAKTDDYWKEEE